MKHYSKQNRVNLGIIMAILVLLISCEKEDFIKTPHGIVTYSVPKGENYSTPRHSTFFSFKGNTFECGYLPDTSQFFTDTVSYVSKITGFTEGDNPKYNSIRLGWRHQLGDRKDLSDTIELLWYIHNNGATEKSSIGDFSREDVKQMMKDENFLDLLIEITDSTYVAHLEGFVIQTFKRTATQPVDVVKKPNQLYVGGTPTSPSNVSIRLDLRTSYE